MRQVKYFFLLFSLFIGPSFGADSFSYSGRLVNSDGSPVSGSVTLLAELAYSGNTATALCSQQITNVNLSNGVFHLKLDFACSPVPLEKVLTDIPANESLAIRITDETHSKVYSYQALHSLPLASMANVAKKLTSQGATTVGQVLTWDGSKWIAQDPATGPDGTSGEIADGSVTDPKLASGISRGKLAAGNSNYILVNDAFGNYAETAFLTITQGGTGASTVAGAKTNLGIVIGTSPGQFMGSDAVPSCAAIEKLSMTPGPTFIWSCITDSDDSKLPLSGGQMSDSIDMNTHRILDVGTPTLAGDAANKAYVDSKIPGEVYSDEAGNVGIGTSTPRSKLEVAGGVQIGDDTSACSLTKVGTLRYSSSSVQFCNGSAWQAFDVAGSGVTFATPGTSGTAPNWTNNSGVYTLNIPYASASGVSAGLISYTDYEAFNNKLNSTSTFSGDVSGTYSSMSVDKIKGSPILLSTPVSGNIFKFNGSNWVNTFLIAADIPNLSVSKLTSGLLPVGLGGTNNDSLAGNRIMVSSPTAISEAAALTDGQLLIGSTGGAPVAANLIAGSGVTIANSAGGISISATGSGGTVTSVSGTAPVSVTSGTTTPVISIPQATSIANGYLTSIDWSTFNNKQASLASGATINGITYPASSLQTMQIPLAPVNATDAVNKQYVDSFGQWQVSGSDIFRASGNVGIGTNAPTSVLSIENDNISDSMDDVNVITYSDGFTPAFFLKKARGTKAAPTPVLANDLLGVMRILGFNGTTHLPGVSLLTYAENDWTTTVSTNNSSFVLQTLRAGTSTERIRITSSGNVGIGTSSPKGALEVNTGFGSRITKTMTGSVASYRRSVILLHEIYSGTLIENNHAVGTLYAKRGATVAYHRQEVAEIRTGSAYNGTTGQLTSLSSDSLKWRLVTVVYNGRTYMAVDIPYADAHVTNFVFDGLIASTAPESLLLIDYYDTQNNLPLNTEINSSIAAFTPVGKEYKDVEAFTVSGNVGIGITAPTNKLTVRAPEKQISIHDSDDATGVWTIGTKSDVNHSSLNFIDDDVNVRMTISETGNVGIGTTAPGYRLQVGNAGDGSEARGNAWNLLSDERLKKNFEPIPDALERITSLNGYFYNWNRGKDKARKMGVKAQEVEKIFPEVVSQGADGYKSVSYDHLVAPLIESVKVLDGRLKQVEAKNKKIEGENQKLREENSQMKEFLCSQNKDLSFC
jgi:hypothetical protein